MLFCLGLSGRITQISNILCASASLREKSTDEFGLNIGTANTCTLATFPKSIAGWDRCDSCDRWDGCTAADCSSAHDAWQGATAAPTCTSEGRPWRASWAGCPMPCMAQARHQPSRSTADWPASRFHARLATTGTSRISFPSLDRLMCSS